jgi:hypothetical protein
MKKTKRDRGTHIDILRQRDGHSYADHDWHPTTGPAFRVRDDDGAFKLNTQGSPYIVKKKK